MLVIKLLVVPLGIVFVTLAGRKWGPSVGGLLVSLPYTSAPVVLFLALEQGTPFAADAARSALLGFASLAAFCGAYAAAARRWGPARSTAVGWGAYVLAAAALRLFPGGTVSALLVAVVSLAAAVRLIPNGGCASRASRTPRWDLPLRVAVALSMVVGLTAIAGQVGPRWSGLLTPFPSYVTVMTVFVHGTEGAVAVRRFLRSVASGLVSVSAGFALLSSLLVPAGVAGAFAASLAAIAVLHAALLRAPRAIEEPTCVREESCA